MTPIRASGVSARISDRTVFTDIDLAIEGMSITALVGANGAGKTTLLRLLHRLIEPSSGKVEYSRADLRVSMVFQKTFMLAANVRDNVAYPLRVRGMAKRTRYALADKVLCNLGLECLADRIATGLSGGEQQKVAMARAIVIEPEVLLLDEPTAHLDQESATRTESWIQDWSQRMAIVLVSHDQAQVARIANQHFRIERQSQQSTREKHFDHVPKIAPSAAPCV